MKRVYQTTINLLEGCKDLHLPKVNPNKIFYRCYNNVDNKKFEKLKKHLFLVLDFESFHLAFKTTLDQFGPLKQKVAGNNNQPFMTKTLPKSIMKRSKLRNKFNKERNAKYWSDYKQQRNLCSNLLKESKARHIINLNVKDVTENKHFWKTIKTFFTDKTTSSNNMILTEN